MPHMYMAYGLGVESELEIPEFLPVNRLPIESATINIRFDTLSAPPLTETPSACRCQIGQNEAYLDWPQGGLFLVRQGREIIIDPAVGADETLVRTFLLGAAFGLLLHQRGQLVLHASAIALDEGAVLFIGDRGAGKSTTAALFQSHGYSLIADDVTVLDMSQPESVMVVPSFPQIKLWPESITSLGQQPEQFPQLNPLVEKRICSSPDTFAQQSHPLLGIYVLDWGVENVIHPLKGHGALADLMHNWYCARFGAEMMRHISPADHLKIFAGLLNQVPVYELIRKESLADIHNLVPVLTHHVKTLTEQCTTPREGEAGE